VGDSTPLPPELPDAAADEAQFDDDPVVEGGLYMDYGTQVKLGKGVYINAYSTWIDTCTITVGARTLFGPHVSLYSGTHPLDPELRNGTKGPETGKEIHIGEDCWLGGNVTVLAGVTIGRGSTVGAGSVVTKVCSRRMCNLDDAAYMQICTGCTAISCSCRESGAHYTQDPDEHGPGAEISIYRHECSFTLCVNRSIKYKYIYISLSLIYMSNR
jgi:acetyltransferase-like isoleucine patch superfamily enzyme